MRVLLSLPLVLVGCALHADFSGTRFRCDEGACPPGYQCIDKVCVTSGDGAPPAGGPDAPPPLPEIDAGTPGMVLVPAGPFAMGCNDALDPNCGNDERPLHTVTLSAFEIDRTEVSQAEYASCVAAGACGLPTCDWDPVTRAELPVVCVDWADAVAYCAFVDKRLPTEAEWEKAARGTDARVYPWGNQSPGCNRANHSGCDGVAHPVDSHPAGASPYGALNMVGNVSEWVADYYDDDYYAVSPSVDPQGPATGTSRQTRGGSFTIGPDTIRVSNRFSIDPDGEAAHRGIRCARSAP